MGIGKDEGARLLAGGSRLGGGDHARGFFHEPTVFADCAPKMRVACEEIFGPVVCLIPVGSLEEAIAVGNSVDYGLSASIYTQDVNKAFTAMREMYTGIFYVNAPTIGAETHLPFGGTKNTGNGHREACVQALDVFSEWKSIYIDFSGAAAARPDRHRLTARTPPPKPVRSQRPWVIILAAAAVSRDALLKTCTRTIWTSARRTS